MHKNWMAVATGFCLAATIMPGTVQAQPNDAKKEIQAVYDKISAALGRKDIDTVMATYADGYQSLNTDGSVRYNGKDAERQRLTRVFSRASSIEDKTTIQSFTMSEGGAVVTAKEDYTRTQTDPQRGLVGKLHEVGTAREFWVKTSGGWQLKRSRTLHLTTTKTVNGQPVQ